LVHTQNRRDICLFYFPLKLAPHIRSHWQAAVLSDTGFIYRFTGADSALPVARVVHRDRRAPSLAFWEFAGPQTSRSLAVSTSGYGTCRVLRTGHRIHVEVLKTTPILSTGWPARHTAAKPSGSQIDGSSGCCSLSCYICFRIWGRPRTCRMTKR
jgi:hypothetical protein